MIKHVDELSNLRNEILYAQPNGVPTIESDVEGHLRRRRRVCITFMRIYALIYPHKQRAIFVQQSINAFLKMMGELAPKFE